MSASENITTHWTHYVGTLTWRRSHLDASSWNATPRAASLGGEQEVVFDPLCRLITEAGGTPRPEKIRPPVERACAFIEAGGQGPNQSTTGPAPLRTPAKPPHPLKPVYEPSPLGKVAALVDVADLFEFVMGKSSRNPRYLHSRDYLESLYRPGEGVLTFTRYESLGQMVWQREVTPAHALPSQEQAGVWFLPTPENGCKPPVKSFVLRKSGAKTGVRLISWDSLTAYIYTHKEKGLPGTRETHARLPGNRAGDFAGQTDAASPQPASTPELNNFNPGNKLNKRAALPAKSGREESA